MDKSGASVEWKRGRRCPGLRAPERASCTQLVSTRAQKFPEAKGSAVRELTVREICSVGACVCKLLTASQVAQSAWLGYRYGAAEFPSSPPSGEGPLTASTLKGLGARRGAARAALPHSSLIRSDADLSRRLFRCPLFFSPGSLDKGTVVTQTMHTSPQPPNTPADGRFCSQPQSPLLWNGSCSRAQSPRPRVVSRFTGKRLSFCFLF